MVFKYSILIALLFALFANYALAILNPVSPAPGTIIATCNHLTVNFASTLPGTAIVSLNKRLIKDKLEIHIGYNAFSLYISPKVNLGYNEISITDLDTGSSITYQVTVINGCKPCKPCKPCSHSSSSSSSSC